MSTNFKDLMEFLLRQKPEVTAEKVKQMIEDKKSKVGRGYLTDQGALFLVAADLGVSFEHIPKTKTGLKDLYVGAKDVTATGRIMNIYPIRKFTKRDESGEASTRTVVIYDKDMRVKVKLWDDHVNIPESMGLHPGDIVKISKAYVKAGLDSKPIVNLGNYSTVEVASDDGSIPPIDSLSINIDDIKEPVESVVVSGNVASNPRINEYVNPRGEAGKSLQLQISNEASSRTLRAVIWNVDETKIPKVFNTGAKVRLIGVRVKQGNAQYGNGDFEIHGDEGTLLEFSGSEQEIDLMPLRIVSIGQAESGSNILCLALDRAGKALSLSIDSALPVDNLKPDTMIECMPSRIFGNTITLNKDDSFVRILDEDDASFPKSSKFETKIKEVSANSPNPYIIEAIVLQAPESTDIVTRTGETVQLSTTMIGDDTGEIKLAGWRNQSFVVGKLNVGDRIKVIGASATMGRQNNVAELTLKAYSSIVKLS